MAAGPHAAGVGRARGLVGVRAVGEHGGGRFGGLEVDEVVGDWEVLGGG